MKFNFSPSKEFKERTKARFLAAFDARYPTPLRPRTSEFVLAIRALAIVLGIAAVALGSATVYADTQNVPADNPLYPLKRLGESVQLTLTVPAAKPQLEATLAARRAGEITDLAERHPSSTLLPNLAQDLANAVTASLGGTENRGGETGTGNGAPAARPVANTMISPVASSTAQSPKPDNLKRVCGTLQSFLNPSSSVVEGGFLGHTNVLQRFEDRCGSANATSSSVVPVGTAATSTYPAQSPPQPRRSRGRGNFEFNGGTATTTVATTTSATTTPASPIPFPRRGENENNFHFQRARTATTSSSSSEASSSFETPLDGNWNF